MDEIQINNFMVFDDVVREGIYDLVIGDEAWEIDYYLHENPNEKRAPYVWLTDFVGFVPMEDGGAHEAFLSADCNAEMIGHIGRHPGVRDRAIFVGNPEDVVSLPFGPDLPWIRDWTESNFSFSGYVSGFDPEVLGDRSGLRAELGYRTDEKVCIVSVGGTGVGHHLLRARLKRGSVPIDEERIGSIGDTMARGRGSSVSGYGLGPAQTPGRALALAALAALTLLARPAEAGGPPQVFYKLRVVTSAGEVVEGQGWIFFVDYLGDRELNAVELEQHANEVVVRGRYAGSDETRERTWSFTPGRAPELELFAGHRRFEHPHGVYYLPRGGRALPLDEIRRIDVVEVIGRGPRIAGDPEVFQSVPEPYLQVDDCGLGCLEKVRSRDPNVTREALEALWAEHFSCETRGNFLPYNLATPQDWGDAQKFALFHEHQLEVLRDPTCLD